ncbi:hypothetical protein Tco_1219132 [Tanacetum coccineum]
MKTLRSCTSGKMVQWMKEADEAFQRMKECLESLPTMVIPTKGETLTMYLATLEENYPELEKLILALVYAARKLRRGRNSIKGQILADFLAETLLTENKEAKNEEFKRKKLEPENAWKLFADGASSSDG